MENFTKIEKWIEKFKKAYPAFDYCPIQAEQIVFEERVKLLCSTCAKYNRKKRCPPFHDGIQYEKAIREYENMLLVINCCRLTKDNYDEVREESAKTLHMDMVRMEKMLLEAGACMAISFIAGACRICREGCPPFGKPCRHPEQSRFSMEAIGINVVKTLKNVNRDISFPVQEEMYRIGLLLW